MASLYLRIRTSKCLTKTRACPVDPSSDRTGIDVKNARHFLACEPQPFRQNQALPLCKGELKEGALNVVPCRNRFQRVHRHVG